jgi:hypothetical protein
MRRLNEPDEQQRRRAFHAPVRHNLIRVPVGQNVRPARQEEGGGTLVTPLSIYFGTSGGAAHLQ